MIRTFSSSNSQNIYALSSSARVLDHFDSNNARAPAILSSHRQQGISSIRHTSNHACQCSPRAIYCLNYRLQAENLCSGCISASGLAGSEDPEVRQGTRPCLHRTWKLMGVYCRLYSGAAERWPQEVRVVALDIGQWSVNKACGGAGIGPWRETRQC